MGHANTPTPPLSGGTRANQMITSSFTSLGMESSKVSSSRTKRKLHKLYKMQIEHGKLLQELLDNRNNGFHPDVNVVAQMQDIYHHLQEIEQKLARKIYRRTSTSK